MDFIKKHLIAKLNKDFNIINIPKDNFIYLYEPINDGEVKVSRINRWCFPICDKKGYGVSLVSMKGRSVYNIYKQIINEEYYYY